MPKDLQISEHQLGALLIHAGLPASFTSEQLSQHNHLWSIRTEDGDFFLKAHTRDWYDWNPMRAASLAVSQETSAYQILGEAGLSTPEIVVSDLTSSNPIGWPCLLLSALDGRPLTDQLADAEPSDFDEILEATGSYLRRMHSIEFEHGGYLITGPPDAPPDPDGWQHWIWTVKEFRRKADETWADDRKTTSTRLIDEILSFAAPLWEAMAIEFEPPSFITGDCHAGQFFVLCEDGRWEVTGVVDMEVASAGTPLADLFKFGVEMAGRFSSDTNWWKPLFRGYGREPAFDHVRLAFMAAEHINYKCLGPHSWPGTRSDILGHLLHATDWNALFDLKSGSVGKVKGLSDGS
ncbi:MAG: aminoglycoside phosphotransferase family protein [Actinomycetota bacterium]